MRHETLESRCLFSTTFPVIVAPAVTPGEFQISALFSGRATDVDTASSSTRRVAVWTERNAAGNTDIRARLFTAAGSPLGADFTVASTIRNEFDPAVSMDDRGFFAVAWTQEGADGNKNVQLRRYTADGVNRGLQNIAVSAKNEYQPDVAVDPSGTGIGDYVVTYTLDFTPTDSDIRARKYNDSGLVTSADIRVAETTQFDETRSSVARSANGLIAVAYQTNSNGGDVHLARLFGNQPVRSLVGSSFQAESNPSVGITDAGTAVVAWQAFNGTSWDIRGRTVQPTGSISPVLTLRSSSLHETQPVVAVDRSEGDFFVGYRSGTKVNVIDVSATGTVRSTLDLGTNRFGPAISINSADSYFVAYERTNIFTIGRGIFGRIGTSLPTDGGIIVAPPIAQR